MAVMHALIAAYHRYVETGEKFDNLPVDCTDLSDAIIGQAAGAP